MAAAKIAHQNKTIVACRLPDELLAGGHYSAKRSDEKLRDGRNDESAARRLVLHEKVLRIAGADRGVMAGVNGDQRVLIRCGL